MTALRMYPYEERFAPQPPGPPCPMYFPRSSAGTGNNIFRAGFLADSSVFVTSARRLFTSQYARRHSGLAQLHDGAHTYTHAVPPHAYDVAL